jgi:hypothetical protein
MPKLWAKSLGERGHKVRIYEARPGGNLMRAVYMHGMNRPGYSGDSVS